MPPTQNKLREKVPQSVFNEPNFNGIAVVGIGCRLPGGIELVDDYWRLLRNGVDAVSETPPSRWNLDRFYFPDQIRRGKTQSRWGGYVSGIDRFDPQLFGISPKEATYMDPQQRMLLEVAWRAMEDAGQPIQAMAGRNVAVFVGISSIDYAVAGLSSTDRGVIGAHNNTGTSTSIAANRISYCFDLRGPSMAVDTACSSSLVSLHLACQSLARGESEMALCGGVNALLLPDFYVGFSQLGVLSPDGRCKTFDARANGYVRGEGAGMVLLKPVDAALRDRDPIYCVIRGTAINQDGHTPGLTVPSREAQQRLVREACRNAGIEPKAIQYVEAHGTGTAVGDPIEATALGNVLGNGRADDDPCLVGSVKTNLGHLEAGAGIASLMKVALAIHHREIPPHLHLESPNPDIDFQSLRLAVPRNVTAWPHPEAPLLAGINGFGYGGANAHAIVEEAPRPAAHSIDNHPKHLVVSTDQSDASDVTNDAQPIVSVSDQGNAETPRLLPISARSLPALAETSARWADFLRDPELRDSISEIAATAAHRRDHFEYRRAIVGDSLEAWAEQLDDLQDELADGSMQSNSTRQKDIKIDAGLLFVCCGQGTQWWAMGRGLYESNITYRKTIDRCDLEFSKHVDWSLTKELLREASTSRMHETSIAQPALFALQIALAECWSQLGIRPAAVVGHSVGEIAAAHIAGALNFQDACLVAVERGRTMDAASSGGAMIAVGLDERGCRQWISKLKVDVSIAAINGPSSATLSGASNEIERVASALDQSGVFTKRLDVQYAFHSEQMAPVREELLRALASIKPKSTEVDLISTVTGERIEGENLDADYWWRNVREGVRFAAAMDTAFRRELQIAIELGPHPTLTFAINECSHANDRSVRVIPSLQREQLDEVRFAQSVASLYQLGVDVDWSGIYPQPKQIISLPPYPFQRQTLWSESNESTRARLAPQHPLLGAMIDLRGPTWQARVDLDIQQMFRDHRVRGNCVLPAAAIIESALAALRSMDVEYPVTMRRFRFESPSVLSKDNPIYLQTTYQPERQSFSLATRSIDEEQWSRVAGVDIVRDAMPTQPMAQSIKRVRERLSKPFDSQRVYDYCEQLGLDYGQGFRGIVGGVFTDGEALAEIELESDESYQYRDEVDPALLDSCFQAMIVAAPCFDHTRQGLFLPSEIQSLQFLRPIPTRVFAHVQIRKKTEHRLLADLDILDEHGQTCLLIRGFMSQRVSGGGQDETLHDWLYAFHWQAKQLPDPADVTTERSGAITWCVFTAEDRISDRIVRELHRGGDRVIRVDRSESFAKRDTDHYAINPERLSDFRRLLEDALGSNKENPIHLLYLWGLDAPDNKDLDCRTLDESTILTTLAPVHLVQAWSQLFETRSAKLTILTSRTQSPDGQPQPIDVAQMPLLGIGRVMISEYSAFRTRLIDLPETAPSSEPWLVDAIVRELTTESDDEDELMYRDGIRYAHRFAPIKDFFLPSDAASRLPSRLEVGVAKGVDDLRYRTYPTTSLGPKEVEIEVIAAGLNFSDVMKALHLYPSDDELPPFLGSECSGRIVRTGSQVSEFAVGDEVMAVAPGAFATHVVVSSALVAPKPNNLTFEQAAAVPIAFLTATHAIEDCARLKQGESLLVHAASGGVGLAALQLARNIGARIFATAGNEEKRERVLAEGAELVMDSRSLSFADQVLEATSGQGVDAILNSLPGEAIPRGLKSLKVGGRFLEIGKRDIYDDQPLGMYPLRNNLALFAIDLDQLFKAKPEAMGSNLRQLTERFEKGELQPLPINTWDVNQTDAAFRFMQQSKHIGKVVVSYAEKPRVIHAGDRGTIRFHNEGTYWIVGGLGGFGLEVAKWLASRGAGTLVLSGRSAKLTEEASLAIDRLKESGVSIHVIPVDVADVHAVNETVQRISNELPPLRGVVHAAMVLEDRLLVDLDRETLQRVLRPKVLGGWNLHQATKNTSLEHFILFSSLSSVFGHAGQANYSAANALLDGLAHHRRSLGLPACVINWGHLGEVGYLARREELGERLRRQGVLSFRVEQAFQSLEHLLMNELVQTSVLRMDWSLWRGLGISGEVSSRFAHLVQQVGEHDQNVATADQIRDAAGDERANLVTRMLCLKIGSLLGIQEERLDMNRRFVELGLDSLMAVELRNWIESQLEVSLSIGRLMRDTSPDDLVELILERIAETHDGQSAWNAANNRQNALDDGNDHIDSTDVVRLSQGKVADNANELLEKLPAMPADEVESLLSHLLSEEGPNLDEQS